MPELPEVETVRRGLQPALEGARFKHVLARRGDLRWPLPKDFVPRLEGKTVEGLGRRKAQETQQTKLRAGDLEMDLLTRTASRAGQSILLQPREFKLLEYLMRNAGRVVTRTMLLERVWEFHFDPKTKIVETHISRLRAKVGSGGQQQLIHTIRGVGYVIRSPS